MPNVNIEDSLYEQIREYCKLNKLTISVFVNDLLRKTFMVEKYDEAPPFFKKNKVVVNIPTVRHEEPMSIQVEVEAPAVDEPINELVDEPINEPNEPEKPKEEKKDEELSPKEKARRRTIYL